jgi:hypothetical protein
MDIAVTAEAASVAARWPRPVLRPSPRRRRGARDTLRETPSSLRSMDPSSVWQASMRCALRAALTTCESNRVDACTMNAIRSAILRVNEKRSLFPRFTRFLRACALHVSCASHILNQKRRAMHARAAP